jgi:hypothetical protein
MNHQFIHGTLHIFDDYSNLSFPEDSPINFSFADDYFKINDNPKKNLSKKYLTSLQKALKDLQDLVNNFGFKCSRKNVKKIMTQVFLARFPNGTSLLQDKMTCPKKIKKSSVADLKDAMNEWIRLDGYDKVKEYFEQVYFLDDQICLLANSIIL